MYRTIITTLVIVIVAGVAGEASADLSTWGDPGEKIGGGTLGTFGGKTLYYETRSELFTSGNYECLFVVKESPAPLEASFAVRDSYGALVPVDPQDYSKLVQVPGLVQVMYRGLTTPCGSAKVTQAGDTLTISYVTSGKHGPTYQHTDLWTFVDGVLSKTSAKVVEVPEEE